MVFIAAVSFWKIAQFRLSPFPHVFWHTPHDTLDKLSPKSLEITGDVLLETVRLLDQK